MKIYALQRLMAKVTPNKAVQRALESFEKHHNTKFSPQHKKELARYLGVKAHFAPYLGTATLFEYVANIAPRQYIDLRQNFKNYDKIYDILTTPEYGLVKRATDDWEIYSTSKGVDFWYFLSISAGDLLKENK